VKLRKKISESKCSSGNNGLKNTMYSEAKLVLKEGGVVAFPTETYYGLAVDPKNENALEKLFDIKKRDRAKSILLLIYSRSQLSSLATTIPDQYLPLMERFWPGALTLIFEAQNHLSPLITGGTGGVGVRISSSSVARELCKIWNQPLTATSANISGHPPVEKASDIQSIFGNNVDFVIDGGRSPAGECSTIIGLDQSGLRAIRQGKIPLDVIAKETSCKIHQ
jgi:L-threonylcarbamoyladenylate synthase